MVKLRTLAHKLRPSTQFKVRTPDKIVDPFYVSPEWRGLCDQIKRERWPRLLAIKGHCCEDPKCTAQHTPQTRIFFDHVKERRDHPELALVKGNIMGRCGSSHTRKTADERRRRLKWRGGSNI
jgi:5-methylcytosine-specific restriction protein A